jgi:hypothetical protein
MARHKKHIKDPYLSYEKAQRHVREITPRITTRAQYWRWHDENKPAYLPKRPDKVYPDFSWNDFLNTTNSFEKTRDARKGKVRTYRPMWEAVRYAQAQAKTFELSTREQWERFYEEYEVPADIPKRPHHVYQGFPGFPVWLGLDARAKLKTEKEGVVAIVALHHVDGMPANCVQLKVWKGGYSSMRDAMMGDDSGMKVGRPYEPLWVWDESGMIVALRKMEQHGHKKDGYYVVPNLHALVWDLSDCMDIFKKPD